MKGKVKHISDKRVATTEYRSWQMMKNRCFNSKAYDYVRNGGRGVVIDPRWFSFDNFLADMGRKPDPKMTLERIDNDRPYAKWNCKWATRKEQSRNRGYYHVCNETIAETLRQLYATGQYYQYELGAVFGLTQAHVSQIVRHVAWSRD